LQKDKFFSTGCCGFIQHWLVAHQYVRFFDRQHYLIAAAFFSSDAAKTEAVQAKKEHKVLSVFFAFIVCM
jgi:hypothetical protein